MEQPGPGRVAGRVRDRTLAAGHEGRRLPGHLVLEPETGRRIRLQVQRRAGDLLLQPQPVRRLPARGRKDVLLLRRHGQGQDRAAAHGLLLRPQDRDGAAAHDRDEQADQRRPRQSGDVDGQGRPHLDLLQLARHVAAVVHLEEREALRGGRVPERAGDQLLLHPALVPAGARVPVPADAVPGRAQAALPDQPRRPDLDRALAVRGDRSGPLPGQLVATARRWPARSIIIPRRRG